MTTRDLFAAHAMQTLVDAFASAAGQGLDPKLEYEDVAKWSFDLADAMMAERQKRKHPDGETTD